MANWKVRPSARKEILLKNRILIDLIGIEFKKTPSSGLTPFTGGNDCPNPTEHRPREDGSASPSPRNFFGFSVSDVEFAACDIWPQTYGDLIQARSGFGSVSHEISHIFVSHPLPCDRHFTE